MKQDNLMCIKLFAPFQSYWSPQFLSHIKHILPSFSMHQFGFTQGGSTLQHLFILSFTASLNLMSQLILSFSPLENHLIVFLTLNFWQNYGLLVYGWFTVEVDKMLVLVWYRAQLVTMDNPNSVLRQIPLYLCQHLVFYSLPMTACVHQVYTLFKTDSAYK